MTSQPSHHLRTWRLLLPLVFQTALIVSLPARAIYTRMTGQSVVLQTVPVDPYDLLRGYSISLTYNISRRETLGSLEGSENLGYSLAGNRGQHRFYVILQPPEETDETPPPEAWTPVRIARDRPETLPADFVALRGRYVNGKIDYGLETYYIPEAQRRSINEAIRQLQPTPEQADNAESEIDSPIVVEVKVDELGNAVLTGIWIGDRHYQF
jgi:uncharacterized membrane-anchored protein